MIKEEFANLGVGETFQVGCRKFKVVESDRRCVNCFFDGDCGFEDCFGYILQENYLLPECANHYRKDKKNVIFKEVENND